MGSTATETPRNIILIGFMGTGKTSVGRKVAESLGFRFVDTDQLVEEREGKPIAKIFETRGEAEFRDLETKALRDATAGQDVVISTGGGIVLRETNRRIISRGGFCVWLKAAPDSIVMRVSGNDSRPLLNTENPRATIEKLLSEREPSYRAAADLEISTDNLSLDEAAYGVGESAKVHFAHEAACAAQS